MSGLKSATTTQMVVHSQYTHPSSRVVLELSKTLPRTTEPYPSEHMRLSDIEGD